MGKHSLRRDTGGYKRAATVTVLASGMMVLTETLNDFPPPDVELTQPLPIPPMEVKLAETPKTPVETTQEIPRVADASLETTAPIAPITSTTPKPVATTKAPPRVVPPPPPPKPIVNTSIIDVARSWLGKQIPYLFGGATLRGMDCSHFVWEVLKQAGYKVPYRNSAALKSWAIPVSKANARPGDLVFWPGHVGIYAGNNQTIDHGSGIGPKLRNLWGSPTFGRIP